MLLSLPDFLIAAGILDCAGICPNKFRRAVGHPFAVTKPKMNCQEMQFYVKSIFEAVFRWLQLFYCCFNLFSLISVTNTLA